MKKIASIICAVCIINTSFVGCKTHKMLSINEASEMGNTQKSLILQTPTKTFNLNNYKFTDTLLVGDLMKKSKIKGYAIHLHTAQNFNYKFEANTSYYCKLSISYIDKITYSKVSTGKTILFAIGVYVVTMVILALALDGPPTTFTSGGVK